jgi:hypothetical protein
MLEFGSWTIGEYNGWEAGKNGEGRCRMLG